MVSVTKSTIAQSVKGDVLLEFWVRLVSKWGLVGVYGQADNSTICDGVKELYVWVCGV